MAHFVFRTETADRTGSRFVTAVLNAAIRHSHTVDIIDGDDDGEILLQMIDDHGCAVAKETSFPGAMQLMLDHRSSNVSPRNIPVPAGPTMAFASN